MAPDDKIRLYIEVSSQNPGADLDSLAETLCAQGIGAEEAECLLAFVPMAFAHVLLSPPVKVPLGFNIRNIETGFSVHGFLKDEVLYTTAKALAQEMVSQDQDSKRLALTIASASAELSAVNQMVRSGSDLANIVLTEPVLLRIPTEHLERRQTKWWQFWKR